MGRSLSQIVYVHEFKIESLKKLEKWEIQDLKNPTEDLVKFDNRNLPKLLIKTFPKMTKKKKKT
jgi:hypothetical protein